MSGKYNSFYDKLSKTVKNMPTREEFNAYMDTDEGRRGLHSRLIQYGYLDDDISYEQWGKNLPRLNTTDTSKSYGVMASDAYTNRHTRQAEEQRIDQEIKAEDAKRKQTADAYNAYAKLEDSFAKYEQSQDVSDLFNVGQQEPIIGEDPKKYWRNRVAKRKEGEAQAKAKVDQEREEMRQRMQLLKDNPDAFDELFGIKEVETPEVGLNFGNSFANGKPVDKRGNVHDNWVSKGMANQRIDAEDKALQLGFQQQELQDMLADPMALDKEMSKLKAELAELTKQRDAYGSKFAKEHPWQMMANLMGRDSFDNPYEVGMYGVDAMETQMQMNNVIARINMLTEAKNAFERGSWSGHGFWNNVKNIGKGMQQFATEINSYTDKYNIESGMALNNLANKIERGEMLTDEEMSWFVTAKLKEEGEKAASQGPTTGAVGYGAPASLEYMVTMALNPAKGASKTISDKIIEAGVRRFGKSAFTKMMAKATGMLTEGAVLSTTLGADNVASDALGRMAGKVGFDDGGNVAVADRVNPLKAMYQSTMASTIESAVEMMGVPIIGKATKGIGKVATKLADAMSYGKVSKLLSAMDKSQIVNWTKGMQKATGWHNLGEEWGEENVTMLANAIIVGDNEIADMFDTRTQLEILGTCALISGVMSTANVAGFASEFHKVNREYKKAKQEVLRQFSSDVWASLDNLITNAQDEDLTVRLADAMDGMAMNQEQRSAIINYLTALKRYQKFNELNDGGKFIIGGPQQAQATQSTSTYEIDSDITLKDEIGNPIDAHIIGRDANGNYMVESSQPINGKRVQPLSADQLDAMVIPNTPDGIQQSEVDGYNLTDANQQAEVSMLTDNARESVATLLGVTPDAVDATLQQVLGDNPTDAKIDARFGGNAQVVKDYMYNVAKTKGMSARLADDIADATAESDRAIDAVDNNGNVVTAKDVNGNDVNVVSGNIVTYEDGLIDTSNSDASVVIRHEDSTTEMVAPTSLTEVVSMPTEQAKATQAQAIAQQMQQAFSDKLNGALDYSQGQQYTMLNTDGSTTDVTILADNGDGNVTVTARDGNKEGGVTDGKEIVLPKSQIQQGVREFKRNQLRGESAQQTSIPQAEAQPTEVAEPTQEPSMPTDEQGNIMYEQMDADSAWDALLAETGGDADMAMTVANEMIADKTKAVEEASKMVAQPGATPQEKIANLKAVKQAQAQAQAELDAWKAIAETPNRRMSLQAEQAEQTESQGQQVADKLPASEEVTTETPTESESTPQVGLVEDARTRTLGDKTRKMLDATAKRLGLQVEFVDEIVTGKDEKGRNLYANAVIVGKKVKIAWHNRNRAIDFLLGHEFTHRMQDLSPEAYAEFVEATKQALGEEEWNKRINRMRDIYKSQGKTISEQGIIDEVVADYAGELVEERGVFDNFVERNKENRGLLSKIADVLRSIKEFFTLGKQRKINNAIARLEALIESASEANVRGDVVNMEKDRYSVSSIFEGTGAIVFNEEGGANIDKDGNFYVIINGKQYDGNNLITLDDIKADKRSVLNMMVEDAIKEGNVTEEHADVIMKKYVDIMNMFLVEGLAENGGYANMADKWMWVGETVYKTVQPNSDKQYTKSIDITTVCKKNEAVIRAMSEMQKRVGYGITPAQILDIYIETQQSGYQVPCPVCYVFSRYLRNGKYASGAILGMEQYGEHLPGGSGETWTADQWVAELRRLEDIDEDKTNKALYNQASADIVEAETMIDNLGLRLQQSNNEAERKELREQIEKADARYRAALNIFSQSALTSWIKTFAIQGSDDKGYKMRDDAQYPEDIELFKEHALDLRKAGETQTLFPAIQRLRNSGGSSTGKAVGFESNNALGDVISGIATGNNDTAYARASKATTEKEFETNRKKATENFKKASKYIKQQTLRGGQRMWSWSDNIEALMPDVVINLMQLELLGGALQTYSKQLEGVNLVARMGGYVNGSLMAKDNGYTEVTEDMIKVEDGKEVLAEDITETIQEPIVGRGIVDRTRVLAQAGSPVIEVDGKKYVLIFDDVIGIDPHGREVDGVHMKGLFDLNKELSKAGNIIVGMNDTHIRVGLADSRIYFIIPWHASGANNHILTEMFRVLGADISSMVSTDYTKMQSEKDYMVKKKDGSLPKIEQSVRDIWDAHKNETNWKCGIKGGIDSSQETLSDSQKHYRELRQAIFDGTLINNKAWLREVQADEFLSQVYNRVQSGTLDNSMTIEDNNHIYPYEYWDTSKTYDEADINGERYIEYCRRLGFSPKFSGIHDKTYNNTGNFTNDKGYWKLLVDRRMYDIHDKFQDLDPVTSEDYTNELVHPDNTNKEFVISEVADAKATNKIVDRVIEKETERFGGEMPMVDYTLSHDEVYERYKAEHDLMMADKDYRKANKAVSDAQANLDALIAEGASKARITTATKRLNTAQLALAEARKNATSAEKKAQKSRFSLTGEEQSIVDEAKANGTYLKAPNGKASNLNERQWVQVRTKAFKDWFGDWENDPENASKVVDENGEPKVVYHGTAIGGFSIFGKAPKGIYFTDSRKAIDDYAWNGNKDVDNYFPFDPFADNQLDIVNKWLSEKDRGMMPKGTQVKEENGGWRIYLPDGTGLSTNFDSETMMMLLMEYATKDNPEFEGKGVYSTLLNMKNPFIIDAESKSWSDLPKTINGVTIPEKYMVVHQKQTVSTDEWAEFLQSEEGRKLGFDGMIIDNVYDSHTADGTITDYIAFEPTQIKSATDNVGTFDASNPDIRYSLATEQVESVLEDYTLNKDNVGDFEYALMQSIAGQSYSARPDYKVLDGVVVRVKGHTPDWDNFVNWETDKAESEKILNVTVGNYEDTDYRRNKEDYESFAEAHPETTAVNVDIEDGTSLADALSQIHEALKAKGIDFEFAPDYSWTKWSEYTPKARYSLASDSEGEVSEGESQQMRYSLRTKPEPKKTIKVYKLFNVDENGNPQALFIDAANSLEVGVWYDADSPTIKDLEGLETEWSYLLDNDGNVVDKKPLKRGKGGNFVGLPSKADVNKATQEGQRWMTVSTSKSGEKAYHTVGINGAGGVSTYALRPGWHATNVPSARHIGVGKDGANAKYRGANQRWFEIEISADVDYNEEARERYLKAHPTYSREKAYSDLKGDIPERIPEDGYYNFKTNSNANPNQDWYIAGAIKIVRPLTEEEGRKISRSKGIAEDLPYKDGVKNFDDTSRYSLIGEQGATALDKSEEATHRMDNLAVAREMEADGKDTKAIRMATGWERGADGKWRYEIEDLKLKDTSWVFQSRRNLTLGDIIQEDELLTAYPQLADLKIKKVRGTGASFYEGTIEIGTDYLKVFLKSSNPDMVAKWQNDLRRTLGHEIQHAIQRIEGFARGGSSSTYHPNTNSSVIEDIEEKTEELNKLIVEYNETSDSYKLSSEGQRRYNQIIALKKRLNKEKSNYQLGEEGYRRLAGEVEARNAEKRMDYTPEQRRETLLRETEDVAREDQIFLMKNGGVNVQAKPEKGAKFSLQGGRSIADKYEKKVNTKGVGGAMHLSKFNAQEAFQDDQLSLKEVQRITEQEYGIVLESYEDAYKAENALSSVNQAEWERYIKDFYEPMMQIIDKWILKGGETEQSVNHYLIAKSGLERNREFTVRDALAEMDKMDRQIINGAYSGTVLQLANALRQGQISQDEYNAQVQDAKDKKNQALENIKNAQQARVDAYRAERDALREQVKNGDISYEEFNKLSDEVALKHAKAEEIADYSGLTALAKQYNEKDWRNFAEQMVVNFENKHDNTDVLWERINNATKKAVEKSYESGITSKEAKNHLDQMFLWYVPMGGMENDTAEDIYSYLNRNADSAFTQTVKRAEGHSEHISDDVMAMIANTMQSAILQGNRNKMKQKFLNMVENYPTDLFTLDRGWVVMQGNEWVESHPEIKADYTAEQVRDAINAHNEEMRNLEEQGLAMSKEGALKLGIPLKNKRNEQEHAISVMRNGQKVTIYVNGNPRVAQALNGKLKDVEQTWIGKAYGKLKRYFSASKTSWNPDFVSSNFSRDIGHSTGITFVKHGIGEWGRSVVMYAPAIATLVAKALGKKSPWGAKYDQYFDEFVRNGGVTGYSHLYSVDDWKIENTKRIDRLRGAAKAIKAHNNMWVNIAKVYNQINSIIENSSRFNEYARSRNRGEDVATSVWNAKEITLNFNKKGSSKTEGLFGGLAFLGRNLVPFFNPIMQGIYQFLKIGKEHKRRMAALCFGYMGMGFMQPFVNAMLVELLGGGDEDDYMKQPEYTRRTNFMLYTGDGYIKIPLAQIFREFYGIGDVVYCAMYGKLSEEDATSQVISQVRKIFSLDDVSTYFDWVADIATNTNFMGNPLWKENEYNKYKPEYTKAYDNTWSFLVSASKWLNEALGGDEHTAPEDFNGKWINPAIWQRLLSELGGGALTSLLDVYDTASALAHGEDVDWANVPIAKRLYTETDEETLQKWIDKEYFSNLDNYKMVRDRMSSLKSSNALDVAEKIDFMYHDPKYLEYVIFDDAQKEIKELRDKADSATDDNRAEREKALYDAEMEVVEAIDAVRAMEDNEVQTYMMEHPEVAYYINKDIEQKVKDNVKELQKAIARKEPDARKALSAYRKTPEYKYYNQIRRILKRIRKLESRLKDETKNIAPSQRVKMKQKIDGHKKELVELRKAYESIGEVKE